MDPFQYQQQQGLQYQQQYGQQQVYMPYTFGVQPQVDQQHAAMGQYGGNLTPFPTQPTAMVAGLYPGTGAQQFIPTSANLQAYSAATQAVYASQNQAAYQTAFGGSYFQQQPSGEAKTNPNQQVMTQTSSTTLAPPSLPTSLTMSTATGSAVPSLENIKQKYSEQYQKWQQQYNDWQAQHANHPDKKLFQEYQQQVQQWQQQQQQLLQVQGQTGKEQKELSIKQNSSQVPVNVMPNSNLPLPQTLNQTMVPQQHFPSHLPAQSVANTPNSYGLQQSHAEQSMANTSKHYGVQQSHGNQSVANTSNLYGLQQSHAEKSAPNTPNHYGVQQSHGNQSVANTSNHYGVQQSHAQPMQYHALPPRPLNIDNYNNRNQVQKPFQGGDIQQYGKGNKQGNDWQHRQQHQNQQTKSLSQETVHAQMSSSQAFHGKSKQQHTGVQQRYKQESNTSQELPKWMQSQANKSEYQQSKQTAALPKWLQTEVKSTASAEKEGLKPLPHWLQGKSHENPQQQHQIPQGQGQQQTQLQQNKVRNEQGKEQPWPSQLLQNQVNNKQVKEQSWQTQLSQNKVRNEQVKEQSWQTQLSQNKVRNEQVEELSWQTQSQQNQVKNKQVIEQSQQRKITKPIPKWLQNTTTNTTSSTIPACSNANKSSTTTATISSEPQKSSVFTSAHSNLSSSAASTTTNTPTCTSSSSSSASACTTTTPSVTPSYSAFNIQKLNPKQELELLQKQSLQLLQLAQLEKQQKDHTFNESQKSAIESIQSGKVIAPQSVEAEGTGTLTKEMSPKPGVIEEASQLTSPHKQFQASVSEKPQVPKLKSVPCRFFPNCRYGAECKFKHPPCTIGIGCTTKDCAFDHSEIADVTDREGNQPSLSEGPHSTYRQESLEMNRFSDKRIEPHADDWHEKDDWDRWRDGWDRPPPPSDWDRSEPYWEDRENPPPYPRGDWERDEQYRSWRESWQRSPGYRSERDAWPPSREEEYRTYERERLERPRIDEYDYPPYREEFGRPPLSPRYRRAPEFDQDRAPMTERRERPYYGQEYRDDHPPDLRRYEEFDRYSRARSPLPGDYDRPSDWSTRDKPPPRDLDWRERRSLTERYVEDYDHQDRTNSPPLDSSRDPSYDREQRYREHPSDQEKRDPHWDRRSLERTPETSHDRHPDWSRSSELQLDNEYLEQSHSREIIPVPEKKKAVVVSVESLLDKPGRDSRPDRIVIVLRGLPGSGKTHVARLIKDKESSNGAHAPRIISLDDYFLTEVEKQETDQDTGKRVKKKVTEYLYEAEMEDTYRTSMFKAFTKTLDDGFFPVVMMDAINNKVEHFEKYWSFAKQKGFEVYIAELSADAHVCAKRNSHQRTFEEISKMLNEWDDSPTHMLRLDVRALLQDAVITEVEMETADETLASLGSSKQEISDENEEEIEELGKSGIQLPQKSKWDDVDSSAEAQLNKLDGIRPLKRRRESSPPLTLSDDEDPYDDKEEDMRIGKKRVRWADIEENKHMEHRRRIGFCIGTDWSLLTDPNAKIPEH